MTSGIVISRESLQRPRSPTGLARYLCEVRRITEHDETRYHEGIRKSGLFRVISQELLPLSDYVLIQYPEDDVLVSPILGNQGYDAEIGRVAGKWIERVEVCMPFDGHSESQDTELAIERGFGSFHLFGPGKELESLRPIFLRAAGCKAQKDYSDATILFVLAMLPPPKPKIFVDAYSKSLDDLCSDLKRITFKAKKVVLLAPNSDLRIISGG